MGKGISKVGGGLALVVLLAGCDSDDNDKAVYGESTGLPVNCRAYVQVAVDGHRARNTPLRNRWPDLNATVTRVVAPGRTIEISSLNPQISGEYTSSPS